MPPLQIDSSPSVVEAAPLSPTEPAEPVYKIEQKSSGGIKPVKQAKGSRKGSGSSSRRRSSQGRQHEFEVLSQRCLEAGVLSKAEYDAATDELAKGTT